MSNNSWAESTAERLSNGRVKPPDWDFSGIYLITNLVNGKQYVGQSQNIRLRIIEHRRSRNGASVQRFSLLYRAVRKYGWRSFSFSILEIVPDLALLDHREAYWISSLATAHGGYNSKIDPRTQRGWKHKASSKLKMSLTKKANPRAYFGFKHSEETIALLRRCGTGRRFYREDTALNPTAVAVAQVNAVTGSVIRIFPSGCHAARSLGLTMRQGAANINGCRSGRSLTAYGYIWRDARHLSIPCLSSSIMVDYGAEQQTSSAPLVGYASPNARKRGHVNQFLPQLPRWTFAHENAIKAIEPSEGLLF